MCYIRSLNRSWVPRRVALARYGPVPLVDRNLEYCERLMKVGRA